MNLNIKTISFPPIVTNRTTGDAMENLIFQERKFMLTRKKI